MTDRLSHGFVSRACRPNALGSLYMVIGSLDTSCNGELIREAIEEGIDIYQPLRLRGSAMSVLFSVASLVRGDRITRERCA